MMFTAYLSIFLMGGYIVQVDSFKNHRLVYRTAFKTTKISNDDLRKTKPKIEQSKYTSILSSSKSNEVIGVPRLHHDLSGLIKWIEKSGGTFDAGVLKGSEGWNLIANHPIKAGEIVMKIPKSICIFSNPDYMEVPLLENAQLLMSSLDKSQWRARLAVALLSERVRPSSHYRAYLRNLPFEFWGMPVFYSTQEFGIMQDLYLMQRTRDRCRFLSEFADLVLTPLQKTTKDPFSGHNADVNAFGWGFASAASRALRSPSVIKHEDGQVMVPGIDLSDHNSNPTCVIADDTEGKMFILKALKDIPKGGSLSTDYGPINNEELLSDYGFTIDNNKYDKMLVSCDASMLNTARSVMGQCYTQDEYNNNNKIDSKIENTSKIGLIGRGGAKVNDIWLHQWQQYWLSAINLYGPKVQYGMDMGGNDISNIDPRLWAYLRILYSKDEFDLTKHGFDPFSVQNPGSVLSAEIESQVVKTLIGIVGIILREYGSDVESDLRALKNYENDFENQTEVEDISTITASSDDIVKDVHRILRNVLNLSVYTPTTPFSVGRVNNKIEIRSDSENIINGANDVNGSFRDGIASVNSPYRIAVANTPTPTRGSTSPAEAILGSVNIKKDNIKDIVDNIDNNVIDDIINNENEKMKKYPDLKKSAARTTSWGGVVKPVYPKAGRLNEA
mmetsp:Transcript_12843/g.12480  ORF Transcript_12843/g.12480 Transcript_12843/m.12480 type:complete len:672 (+) Transcript_12843:150-2165(+)